MSSIWRQRRRRLKEEEEFIQIRAHARGLIPNESSRLLNFTQLPFTQRTTISNYCPGSAAEMGPPTPPLAVTWNLQRPKAIPNEVGPTRHHRSHARKAILQGGADPSREMRGETGGLQVMLLRHWPRRQRTRQTGPRDSVLDLPLRIG